MKTRLYAAKIHKSELKNMIKLCLVVKMILKLLSSYLILSMSNVGSYVLFAANIDDFRSIANKIIPGQLADQLTNMADKRDNLNYRHDIKEPISKSDYGSSDDSTEDSHYSETLYNTANPLLKDKAKSLKKRYLLQNENIDLDELVKRVKHKLENEYKVTNAVRFEANNEPSRDDLGQPDFQTTGKQLKLKDYYYKDENLNVNFNKDTEYEDVEKTPLRPDFTTERNEIESVNQYDGENIDYNEEEAKYAPENVDKNKEKNEYVQENPNENMDYDPVNVKQQSENLATLKETVRDANNGREGKQFDDYGNIITKEVSKNVPEKYEQPKVVSYNNNNKKMNAQKVTDTEIKEAPDYYEDNAKETQIDPVGGIVDIFKGVDMLNSTIDSYEDYVTPKRDNIFDSAEVATQKSIKPILGVQKFASDRDIQLEHSRPKAFAESLKTADQNIKDEVIRPPRKVSARTPNPRYIKAKTARMWYKDPNIENYDDSAKKIRESDNKKTTRKRLRTMFPTRAHIKISSPNYFAKLPAVAEKYNFDEPIPEKDREPEVIKHIGNPSAMINKKIKI